MATVLYAADCFFAISFFEVDVRHSFIKHLRIWYLLGSNNGIKRSKRLGPGLESIRIHGDSLGIIRNGVPETPKALFLA